MQSNAMKKQHFTIQTISWQSNAKTNYTNSYLSTTKTTTSPPKLSKNNPSPLKTSKEVTTTNIYFNSTSLFRHRETRNRQTRVNSTNKRRNTTRLGVILTRKYMYTCLTIFVESHSLQKLFKSTKLHRTYFQSISK